tara:strand:- start:114 stop:770 length:657 start_codon:yes stop_codon:yes gene_type:complete
MKVNEVTKLTPVQQAIKEHVSRGVPFRECIFRPGSEAFREFYRQVRNMHSKGLLEMDWEDEELIQTDIGELVRLNDEIIPLDVPFVAETYTDRDAYDASEPGDKKKIKLKKAPWEKDEDDEDLDEAEYQGREVKLNSPKRGGSKKYYVYVRNPKTGKVKKVSWGDTTGLKTKANNPGAVKSFVARHKCKQKKDKTKAGYWACRTPRYKSLGVKGGQWW